MFKVLIHFKGPQFDILRCVVAFCKMSQFTRKSAPQLPKIEGGGVQPIRAMPIFRLLFLNNGFPKFPNTFHWCRTLYCSNCVFPDWLRPREPVWPKCGPSCGPQSGPSCGPLSGPSCGPQCGPSCGPQGGPSYGFKCGPSYGPECGPSYGPSCVFSGWLRPREPV